MATRISTSLIHIFNSRTMLELQADMARNQQQIASGKRLLQASDDPTASSAILNLNVNLESNHQYQKNADVASARLSFEETTLDSLQHSLMRIRDLVLQAKNDINGTTERQHIAKEIEQIADQVVGIANVRDTNNEYLFAGNKTLTQPFIRQADGSYLYTGDEGERFLKIGAAREVSVSDTGKDIFMKIPDGNGTFSVTQNPANTGSVIAKSYSLGGVFIPDDYSINFTSPTTYEIWDSSPAMIQAGAYTSGDTISFNGASIDFTGQPVAGDSFTVSPSVNKDVFSTIKDMVDSLNTDTSIPLNNVAFHNTINYSMYNLDQILLNVETHRADLGGRLNTIDEQKNINETIIFQNEKSVSTLEDLDYASAIMDFQNKMMSLQAAQQSYVRTQGTSLFDFL